MESGRVRMNEISRSCKSRRSPSRSEGQTNEQLLQGIPDEVTFDKICTRLPWRAFLVLSSVNRAWRQAIRSRQVYESRVHSHSTETLVVLNHNHDEDCDGISLYSMREKKSYQLPPIPHVPSRIPWASQCVALDGKIYLLGGAHQKFLRSSKDVYVLDLAAGQRGWKQCASMRQPRLNFACGAIDGKIYVFGGYSYEKQPMCGSEVYDPKQDSWSSIKSGACWRFGHRVATLGEELVLYGGSFWDPQSDNSFIRMSVFEVADFLEFYHPGEDKWRRVNSFEQQEGVFVAQGKLHKMTYSGICVHDFDTEANSWAQLHSSSFTSIRPDRSVDVDCAGPVQVSPITAEAVNGDLLAIVTTWTIESTADYTHVRTYGPCLLQATGFGSKNKELVWERANCFFLGFQKLEPPFLCPIHL